MTDRIGQIEARLRAAFSPDSLEVVDESRLHVGHEGARSGGGHYAVTIVSARFAGQPLVLRHRMVYGALADMMDRDIHALRINAITPEEL